MVLNEEERKLLLESAIVVCSHCIENTLDKKINGESCISCRVTKILNSLEPPLRKICHVCGNEMDHTNDYSHVFVKHDVEYPIHNIEADICPVCGEILYSSKETARIEAIIRTWDADYLD